MIFEFAIKEPDKAYVSNQLWLPKAFVREYQVKQSLEFLIDGKEGQEILRLWGESKHHIVCPREFLPPSQYPTYRFPFIDLRQRFEHIDFVDMVVPRDDQHEAWAALAANDNGILNLGCGKGKTKLAVKKIAQKKVPALVIVPDGGIMTQWIEAINGGDHSPQGLKMPGKLGLIAEGKFEWENCDVVIALISTLALRIRDGKVPEEFFRRFGLVVYDEVHRLGAPVFSLCAPPFYGDRLGLTATVQREDGLDPIYRYHLGEPFFTDLSQDLIPRIYFWRTPAKHAFEECRMKGGTINMSLLRTLVGREYFGNVYRYYAIQEALKEGRKILCLSHSKDQLKLLHSICPESGLILGATPKKDRTKILRSHQLVFAIAKLGSEGVDDPALDTLFWLTPFRSKISLQQSMGRIQRAHEGKVTPVMVVFEDYLTNPLKELCHKLRSNLRAWGFKIETHLPSPYPPYFPEELHHVYAAAYASLPPRGTE